MTHKVALVVGAGIGPEIVPAVLELVAAAGVDIEWHRVDVPAADGKSGPDLLDAAAAAVEQCGVGLKTKLISPSREEMVRAVREKPEVAASINPNSELRRRLGLYAGVRPIKTIEGLPSRYPNLDLVLVRENTEDIYKGIEHEIVPGVVQSIKVVSREACERIARYTFAMAKRRGRKSVAFIHKGNIMKRSDGLFLETVKEVAGEHPEIDLTTVIVDAACMQMVLDPYRFDVLLSGNLYGDILSNLGTGLAGGISGSCSINIGKDRRVFEALHGDAPDLVGKGLANPLPLLTPAIAMLDFLGEEKAATRLEAAVSRVLSGGTVLTADLGGTATTAEMCSALGENL